MEATNVSEAHLVSLSHWGLWPLASVDEWCDDTESWRPVDLAEWYALRA